MWVVMLARWLWHHLTAAQAAAPDGSPGSPGAPGVPAPAGADGAGEADPPPGQDLTAPPAPTHVNDLIREGMKDPDFARELDRLLDHEHRRSLHSQELQTLSFLAKTGCVSLCLAVVVVTIAPAVIIGRSVVAHYDISPWHFAVVLSGVCGLLTAAVGWVVRTLRRGRRQDPAAPAEPRPPADGASADGPAPRAGAG
ncbi:hypothetical protein [Streptomyces alboflavus]|uniref:hypothetical protein n=1 Tax=Streptomyces alboflavus TaxID=67267 RepID=UPI0004C0A0E4|nr:hypothetical protein [Streptomyces alboflavus]